MLARAESRRRETAVRAALGAGRARLFRQFLTESVLTSLLGGALGVALAMVGVRALVSWFGHDIPRSDEITISLSVLGFSFVVAVVTGIVMGLVPALQARPHHDELNDGARGSSRTNTWFRGMLVTGQFDLALVLLLGASLLLKSFLSALHSDLGFDKNNLVVVSLWFPSETYSGDGERERFANDLTRQLDGLPMVRHAAFTSMVPIRNYGTNVTRLSVVGREDRSASFVEIRGVTPQYFQTLGVPILRGRMFDERDAAANPPVVVINQELARQLFNDGVDPIGAVLDRGSGVQVVGVVGDVRQFGPDRPPRPTFYQLQQSSPISSFGLRGMTRRL